MVAVSSLGFSVYEQYTSNTYADGSSTQSGTLKAGVTVGTDDGSSYGSAIVLDVDKKPATQGLKDGLRAVNTLTQLAKSVRTQVPKDEAAGRLARAIQALRALDLFGGGIRAVQQAVRIAQEIASAMHDLSQAEQAIAADGGSVAGAGASLGAAAAAAAGASAAAAGPTTSPTASTAPKSATNTTTDEQPKATPAAVEAGYSGQVGGSLTGLVAEEAGLGSGPAADGKVTGTLAQAIVAQLQATGLPVDGGSLVKALNDLIANPVLGAQELQASARQAGLNVTVSTSLSVKSTLADPRNAAATRLSPAAAAATIDDPYDKLIRDAVAALASIGKGLKRVLPHLLNSRDRKTAHDARKAQQDFDKAVVDTVTAIGQYYHAKAEVEAEGGSDGAPSPMTKAAIDAADAVVNGPGPGNDDGGADDDGTGGGFAGAVGADASAGAVGADGAAQIAAGSVAGTSIAIAVNVSIQA